MTDSLDAMTAVPYASDTFLSFDLAIATMHGLSLYSPPSVAAGAPRPERRWLVSEGLLGGTLEIQGPSAAWASIQDLAATLAPRLWPSLMKRHLPKAAWTLLVDDLKMPGASPKTRWVHDPQALVNWVAWNREALRHRLIYAHSTAPTDDVLHSSDLAIEVGPRFREEAISFLALPAENGVRLAAKEMAAIIWKLAQVCHDLDVVEMRRHSLIGTAGLNSEEDYEDLRALVWRGNQSAKVVLAALESLEDAEAGKIAHLDELASELEFTVRDRRMDRKQNALDNAKRIAEALLPAA